MTERTWRGMYLFDLCFHITVHKGAASWFASYGLLSLLSFRTQDHSTGMSPHTMGQALSHQSLRKYCRLACSPILWGTFLNEPPSSQMILACVSPVQGPFSFNPTYLLQLNDLNKSIFLLDQESELRTANTAGKEVHLISILMQVGTVSFPTGWGPTSQSFKIG